MIGWWRLPVGMRGEALERRRWGRRLHKTWSCQACWSLKGPKVMQVEVFERPVPERQDTVITARQFRSWQFTEGVRALVWT